MQAKIRVVPFRQLPHRRGAQGERRVSARSYAAASQVGGEREGGMKTKKEVAVDKYKERRRQRRKEEN